MKTLLAAACIVMFVGSTSFIPDQKSRVNGNTISFTLESFDYFRAHRQGKAGIALSWGVTSGYGASYFIIERSYDGEYFDPIGNVPMNGSKRNNWMDNSFFPGYIHYRIVCVMFDGSEITSDVETVRIVQR